MKERADHKTRFSATNQPVKTGRPKEARDKLSRAFLTAFADDFEKHGAKAIERVRKDDAPTYVRVAASLMPKEIEITDPLKALSDDKLATAVETLADLLRDRADLPPVSDKPQPTVN